LNLLVLRHEAARLGIRPGSSEVADVVRTLPVFQGGSGFDLHKFSDFVQNALAPNGLAEEHIEQLVRDQLCLDQIKQLLGTGVSIPAAEIDADYQRAYDKLYVSLIRLRPDDLATQITISDDDVQKYYDTHKTDLKTEEKRKVDFVSLALTDDQKKLAGKERIEVLQGLSDRATDFTQALLEKGCRFHQAAEKFQVTVRRPESLVPRAGRAVACRPTTYAAAFKLTTQEPNSDPIQWRRLGGFASRRDRGGASTHTDEAKPKIAETITVAGTRVDVNQRGGDRPATAPGTKTGQGPEAAAQQAE
jgi:hypothetical protein